VTEFYCLLDICRLFGRSSQQYRLTALNYYRLATQSFCQATSILGPHPHGIGSSSVRPLAHRIKKERPFALTLTQRRIMLDHIGLLGIDLERLPKRVLDRGIAVGTLQDSGNLLQSHSLIIDRLAVDGRE
jgi:hypothetical protein